MAIPTVAEIVADAQALLGEPVGGEIYTATMLAPFYGAAYREMINLFIKWDLPVANREAFCTLPALTSVLTPAQAGIDDFGEAQMLWERGSVLSAPIADVTDTTPVFITTTAPHGFGSVGSVVQVTIGGITGVTGVNGIWFATIVGPSLFSLNGSVAGGLGSNGTATMSSEQFSKMTFVERISANAVIDPVLGIWSWENEAFQFTGASEDRQLRIEYSGTGAPPTSGAVGIDNSRDFLAHRTAGLACATRDETERAMGLKLDALGPKGQADGSGGFLRDLALPMLKAKQKSGYRRGPFRPRRNSMMTPWSW